MYKRYYSPFESGIVKDGKEYDQFGKRIAVDDEDATEQRDDAFAQNRGRGIYNDRLFENFMPQPVITETRSEDRERDVPNPPESGLFGDLGAVMGRLTNVFKGDNLDDLIIIGVLFLLLTESKDKANMPLICALGYLLLN